MTTPAAPAEIALHLENAVTCLDCSRIFPFGVTRCPSCTSASWVPIEHFLRSPAVAAWRRRAVDEEAVVKIRDVLHHAGNGLSPALLIAERLGDALRTLTIARVPGVPQLAVSYAERIVIAINRTMDRLYALTPPPAPTAPDAAHRPTPLRTP